MFPDHSQHRGLGAPPGTVPLEGKRIGIFIKYQVFILTAGIFRLDLQRSASGVIILQPKPTRDPNDPLNWKIWEKYLNFGLVLLYSLLVFAFIGASTPTWAPMNIELGYSYEILQDSYAVGSAALCIGALIFIPTALKFGRRPVYVMSTLLQFGVAIWFAKIQTVADLMLVNAFSCLLGALAEVIVQMTVADIFFIHQRGMMNTIYVWIMVIGSALGPLAAGYVTTSQGWRWVWWWMAILFGISFLLFLFFYEETKFLGCIEGLAPVNQPQREDSAGPQDNMNEKEAENNLDAEVGGGMFELTTSDIDLSISRKTYLQRFSLWSSSPGSLEFFLHHIYQPLIVTFTFPAALYVAVVYGMLTALWQVMITVVASVMPEPPYAFTASQIGLMSLAPFIGTTIGSVIVAPLSDRLVLRLATRNGGVFEPEMRLWILLAFSPLIPVGTLLFGYSLGNAQPWYFVAIGYGLYGLAMGPISSTSLTYLTDAYTNIVADSVAGVTFIRNIFATIFVFALTPWATAVGIANVFLTMGILLSIVLIPGTIAFLYYGKSIRRWTTGRYHRYSAL
ncbi:major facilitator superfamily domain-containing protein [Penicillium concentricum]|uniref:Major facilitator superfamily domain-containing protein n=1 Tax=Penicillium concentricum TaxID=293559 RepID=A0A9W9S8C0_9EURO|nr:major facilitator superfamily domain-containing protein [Penicillium concentricum]KAJ5373487.1 major facilitator superfamily domain-containing protein [Penicillium concentricum]